jgi:hypothetical protein
MEVTINFKAKAGDKVLAKNPRRNGKPEYFTIKYLNYLNFGTHEIVRYEALTCREAKNGKINVVIDNDDILEVCL